jgi:hypothetical protein
VKRRYSVTGDVLSYRRCKRQYGFFRRRGFTSAQSGQLYFGTVIHETLDRIHAQFRGEIEDKNAGTLSSPDEIKEYFQAAEDALLARGIRYMSHDARERALQYVQRFVEQHGRDVFPRIVDTEHRLQKDTGEYVLHGIVDVIAETDGKPDPDWGRHEIWDYKGTHLPAADSTDLQNYEFQMRVYARLYEMRNGTRPRRAVLLFLAEEEADRQRHEVSLKPGDVDAAVAVFEETVAAIERSISRDDWSCIRRAEAPDQQTCDGCDLRWSCPAPAKPYRIRAL